jgi:signal transduction histidine kinase
LHDVLGHQLTALALQLEVLKHTAPVAVAPQISASQQLAKELLASIRAVVQDQNTLSGLDLRVPLMTLLRRLPGIELKIINVYLLQSADLAQALLLALQEGVSNAIRHGGATQLCLTMQMEGSRLTLQLSDNGRGIDDAAHKQLHRGLGLPGMAQRLAPFEGRVQLTKNSDAGCCLNISVEDTAAPNSTVVA